MKLILPATGLLVGTVVGAVTYKTLSETGRLTTSLTGTGLRGVSFLAGQGVGYLAGPVAGRVTAGVTHEIGQHYIVPTVERGTHITAVVTAAVAGGVATIVTSAAIWGGKYTYNTLKELPLFTHFRQYAVKPLSDVCETEDGDFQLITFIQQPVAPSSPIFTDDDEDITLTPIPV